MKDDCKKSLNLNDFYIIEENDLFLILLKKDSHISNIKTEIPESYEKKTTIYYWKKSDKCSVSLLGSLSLDYALKEAMRSDYSRSIARQELIKIKEKKLKELKIIDDDLENLKD